MALPRSSRVSESLRESHAEFIKNHVLNESTAAGFDFKAARCKFSSSKTERESVRVSTSMLQDLFDELGVVDKAATPAIRMCYSIQLAHPKIQEQYGTGTSTVILRFTWMGGHLELHTHCYLTPNGLLAGDGLLDPKAIRYAEEIRLIAIDPRSIRNA